MCALFVTGLQSSLKPAILKILRTSKVKGTTIVYTTFQAQADEIAGYLYVNGISAASYHAGKSNQVPVLPLTHIGKYTDLKALRILIVPESLQ